MVNRTAAHGAAVFCVFGAFFEALFNEKQVVPLSVKFRKFFFSQINCKRSVNAFLAHFSLYRGGADDPEKAEILRRTIFCRFSVTLRKLPLRERSGDFPLLEIAEIKKWFWSSACAAMEKPPASAPQGQGRFLPQIEGKRGNKKYNIMMFTL